MRGRTSVRIGGIGAMAVTAVAVAAFLLSGVPASIATGGPEESGSLFELQVSVLEHGGLTTAQARHEVETQTAIEDEGLVAKLEAKLGSAFGGVWFEPAAAKLHVGVISAESQATVEALAGKAGLSEDVVTTPVRSTWSQLKAAEEALSRRFSRLLAGGKMMTALQPDSNAVEVMMASSVSSTAHAELKREASSAPVAVSLVSSRSSSFGIAPEARCRGFEFWKAYCDPTIAAGVSIFGGGAACTAGPAVIREKPKTDTTETFLLTAGHCISKVGDEWTSFNKGETSMDIGKATIKLTGKAGGADLGVIKVENPEWTNATQTPVDAAVALPKETESDPLPVVVFAYAVKGQTSCHSGSSTGTQCGEVTKVELEGPAGQELYEVQKMTKVSESGDSGGPWFSEIEGGEAVEGIHIGRLEEGDVLTNFALVQQAWWDIGRLRAKGYEYEPLTTATQTRPECPMPGMKCFEAESYPATITGSQTGTQTFTFESGKIECGGTSFSTTLAEQSNALEVQPSYGSCVFGLLAVTADVNECKYKFAPTSEIEADKFKGTVDIVCPSGKSMALTSPCGCTVTIGSQTALGTVEYVDTTAASPKKDVDVKLSLSGINYTEGSGCKNPGTRSTGTYGGELIIKATTGGGTAQGFWVGG